MKKSTEKIIPWTGLVKLFLDGKREESRWAYWYDLQKIARHLGEKDANAVQWQKLRYKDTVEIVRWLLASGASSTAHKACAALHGILETARDNDPKHFSGDDYLLAIKPLKVKVDEKEKPAAGRMLASDELAALLRTCLTGPRRRASRDRAIIALMAGCGLRRAEVCDLEMSDYNQATGQLSVYGKERKRRTNYLANSVKTSMDAWLVIRGSEPGPIFPVLIEGDQMIMRHMATNALWKMLGKRGKDAGLEHFEPHDFRRTFISNLIDANVDIATVAELVGHANVAITAGYDRRGEKRKADAAGLIHLPEIEEKRPL